MKNRIYYSLLGLVISLFLMSPSCEKTPEAEPKVADTSRTATVEVVTPIIDPLSFDFGEDYKNLWDQVDSLQTIGLYSSALDVVKVIFDSAKKDNNAPQVVKSVIHKMKYNSYLEEDDYVLAIAELSDLAKTTQFPLKQIIHSVTAQTYWGYFQRNRWQFYNRTETEDFENNDIRTWDLNRISDQVNEHFMLSLSSPDSLQKTKVEDFLAILIDNELDRAQRPTLYDFLAHEALNFFESTEPGLTRPQNKFQVQGTSYFANDSIFLTTSTDSEDDRSHALRAVKIFQKPCCFSPK